MATRRQRTLAKLDEMAMIPGKQGQRARIMRRDGHFREERNSVRAARYLKEVTRSMAPARFVEILPFLRKHIKPAVLLARLRMIEGTPNERLKDRVRQSLEIVFLPILDIEQRLDEELAKPAAQVDAKRLERLLDRQKQLQDDDPD